MARFVVLVIVVVAILGIVLVRVRPLRARLRGAGRRARQQDGVPIHRSAVRGECHRDAVGAGLVVAFRALAGAGCARPLCALDERETIGIETVRQGVRTLIKWLMPSEREEQCRTTVLQPWVLGRVGGRLGLVVVGKRLAGGQTAAPPGAARGQNRDVWIESLVLLLETGKTQRFGRIEARRWCAAAPSSAAENENAPVCGRPRECDRARRSSLVGGVRQTRIGAARRNVAKKKKEGKLSALRLQCGSTSGRVGRVSAKMRV